MHKVHSAMLALLILLLVPVVCGCVAPVEPPRLGAVRSVSAASYGVSNQSPVAEAVLVQSCHDTKTCTLTPFDATTGEPVAGVTALAFDIYNFHAFSPDGTLLATIHYPDYGLSNKGSLLLTDLESWTTITATTSITNIYSRPVFSPDGRHIALLQQLQTAPLEHRLRMLEVTREPSAKGAVPLDATFVGESASLPLTPVLYAFSGDGDSLHLYGSDAEIPQRIYNPLVKTAIVDAGTLEVAWQRPLVTVLDGQYLVESEEESANPNYWDPHLGRWWQPGRVFSRNGNLLYLVHANESRMTTVDFANRRITNRAVERRMGLLERLLTWTATPAHAKILNGIQLEAALSYDGSDLYVTGKARDYDFNVYSEEYVPLRIIEAKTGRLLATGAEGTITESADLDLRIFLNLYNWQASDPAQSERTVIADPSTGAMMQEIERWTILPARRLDGVSITLGVRSAANGWGRELAILDATTFAPTPIQIDMSRGWGEFITR